MVFYNDNGVKKEDILNEFEDILIFHTTLLPEEVETTKNGTIQFDLHGVSFDLLVARNNVKALAKDKISEQRLNSILKFKESGNYEKSGIKELGIELAETSVLFMKSKSKFVHDVARLCKYWAQKITFKPYVYGKSFIMELLATEAAMIQEKNDDPSIHKALKRFLEMICNLREQDIVFNEYYKRSDIPKDIVKQIPLLMDPTNPFNNVLDTKRNKNMKEFFDVFGVCALHTLTLLENGCNDTCIIFCPQPSLYNMLRQKK